VVRRGRAPSAYAARTRRQVTVHLVERWSRADPRHPTACAAGPTCSSANRSNCSADSHTAVTRIPPSVAITSETSSAEGQRHRPVAHDLVELVVLIERCTRELDDDGYRYGKAPIG
jgi:hypothetical protein